jgi:hypothetical protein
MKPENVLLCAPLPSTLRELLQSGDNQFSCRHFVSLRCDFVGIFGDFKSRSRFAGMAARRACKSRANTDDNDDDEDDEDDRHRRSVIIVVVVIYVKLMNFF